VLANAIKFCSRNMCITIKAENAGGDFLKVSVEDEGQGIDAEQLGTLFETFNLDNERQLNQQRGIGIGLSTARALIELIGGSITVVSDGKDKGTSVTLMLPLGSAEEAK
jgi:signal transduction histidine kinase